MGRPAKKPDASDLKRAAIEKLLDAAEARQAASEEAARTAVRAAVEDPADLLQDDAVYDLLSDEERNQLAALAMQDLDTIRQVQTDTREPSGRLKDAHLLAQVLALRLYGHSPAETAAVLGIPTHKVLSLLHRVRRDSSLELQIKRLDDIGVSLAADNIIRGLILGDKDYTVEFAKGRGMFKTHASVKEEREVREFKFVIEAKLPAHLEGKPLPQIKAGAVVGAEALPPAPATTVVEGELVDG
jgi:DNA-directed RNA polymerase specialized sigma24 family protein